MKSFVWKCVCMGMLALVAVGEPIPPSACDNPATTDNGQFTIELLNGGELIRDGSLVTFEYKVCKTSSTVQDLSHWNLDLTQLEECLKDGCTLADLLYACSPDPCYFQVSDPTTGITGIKWDDLPSDTDCGEFSFTLDESCLKDGFQITVGCVCIATKAGNQDIRGDTPPGFADVYGPVCLETPPQGIFEGCTPGFWKNHHAGSPSGKNAWPETGYETSDLVGDVFAEAPDELQDDTLLEALSYKGGKGKIGKARILLRAAVAALLNAAHPDVNYPLTEDEVKDLVDAALETCKPGVMIDLADELDLNNNLGCEIF